MKKLTTFILLFLSAALFCMGQQKVNVMVDIENIAHGGSLPKPTYNGTEKGIVVVQVIVDKQGNGTRGNRLHHAGQCAPDRCGSIGPASPLYHEKGRRRP